jgi:hypothetical protein
VQSSSSESAPEVKAGRPVARRSRKTATHRWIRLVHVYTSMVCFIVVLFFALTGITLNHPTWSLGFHDSQRTYTGVMPDGWRSGDSVDWLVVSEFFRDEHSVRGSVTDRRADDVEASITYRAPGYSAEAVVEVDSGQYRLEVDSQGPVAVLNDLHKGRNADSSWKWLIDLSGALLALIAATGLGVQLFLRKRRRSALITAAGGLVLVVLFIWLTTN